MNREVALTKGWEFASVQTASPQGIPTEKLAKVDRSPDPILQAMQFKVGAPGYVKGTPSDNEMTQMVQGGLKWHTVQSIPAEVHSELIKDGSIPDPFIGMNEWEVQWVGESCWVWRTEFEIPNGHHKHSELVFKGLDTICHVFIDARKVLYTDNMFREYRLPIAYAPGSKHTIVLFFESAFQKARAMESAFGSVIGSHGQTARAYLRKSQYMWQWDWGLRLVCCGPCGPILLRQYDTRIKDIYARADVKEDLTAEILVDVQTAGEPDVSVRIKLVTPQGKTIKTEDAKYSGHRTQFKWTLERSVVDLWWPYQLGKPALYTVEVDIYKKGSKVDSSSRRFGVRRVRLLEHPFSDQAGLAFVFEVNNTRMFLSGSCWIPADGIPTNIDDQRYERWLSTMVEGNQNVVRIWGGGIYEPDVFYDLCDEKGLLVMHDFQFACALYPANNAFVENVHQEVVYQLTRLRSHPSIIFWAGNNEDYQKAEQYDKYHPENSAESDPDMPARLLYEILFPQWLQECMDPVLPYLPSSPYRGDFVNDPAVGDCHMWRVWARDKRPYQDWDQLSARFVSEFGMLAYPNMSTIKQFINDDSQLYTNSLMMDQHQKSRGHATLVGYVSDNLQYTQDLAGFVYASQLMQAECLEQAYRVWMREFKGKGREYNSGAVLWQINDSWPCISWAIVDYYGRRKAAFYTIKRACAPLAVSIKRRTVRTYPEYENPSNRHQIVTSMPWYRNSANYIETCTISAWAFNSSLQSANAHLVVSAYDITSGERVTQRTLNDVYLAPVQSSDLLDFEGGKSINASNTVYQAKLYQGDTLMAEHASWPEPLKYIVMPENCVKVQADATTLKITASHPCKGLIFEHSDDVTLEDNCVDIMPGEVYSIAYKRGRSSTLSYRYYTGLSTKVF